MKLVFLITSPIIALAFPNAQFGDDGPPKWVPAGPDDCEKGQNSVAMPSIADTT